MCVLDSIPSPFTFSPLPPHVCSCSVLYAFVLCLCEMQMQLKWKNAKRNIEQRLHALVSCMRLHVRACPCVCACLCVHSANAKLMHFILCNRKGENSANLAMRIKLARNSRKLHHIDLTTSNAPRPPHNKLDECTLSLPFPLSSWGEKLSTILGINGEICAKVNRISA